MVPALCASLNSHTAVITCDPPALEDGRQGSACSTCQRAEPWSGPRDGRSGQAGTTACCCLLFPPPLPLCCPVCSQWTTASQAPPFSLSAQAQQWGPATRGPASQGEVPGGLRDSCQWLLNFPHPHGILILWPPLHQTGQSSSDRHPPSPRPQPEPHHSPTPRFQGRCNL